MDISADGGALCASRQDYYGTSIFTENLLNSLALYDRKNFYDVYTFCPRKDHGNIHFQLVRPTSGYMKVGVTIREFQKPHHIFLALNQAMPLYTQAKIISFCHGLSYIKHSELYEDSYKRLSNQLKSMVGRSNLIVTSSVKVTRDLKALFPLIKIPVVAVPFGVPLDFQVTLNKKRKDYFLFAGSNSAVKRVDLLVDCFKRFIASKKFSHWELYLVGPHSVYQGNNIQVFQNITRNRLRQLYSEAAAYVTASCYESFNFPIIEALSQNCPVVAMRTAVIDEFRREVEAANSRDEFTHLLRRAAEGKIHYNNAKQIKKDFSWKSYTETLKKLYETVGNHTDQK